jgi:hypothetical protein
MKENCWIRIVNGAKLAVVGCLAILFQGCTGSKKEVEVSKAEVPVLESGEALTKTYCGSCHLYPEASLLDKQTWRDRVLPSMGHRLGIYKDRTRDSLIEKGMAGTFVNRAGIFPEHQRITDEQWESIKQFYIDHAPDSLAAVNRDRVKKNLNDFKTFIPDFRIPRPAITAIAFQPESQLLYVADCSLEDHSTITILNNRFKPVTSLGLPHPVSDLALRSDTLYMLMMGHFIPSDEPAGRLLKAIKNSQGEYTGYVMVLKDLQRPVDAAYADVDGDGDEDIIVCEFGNHTGSVSLFVKVGKNRYRKEVLSNMPGSIQVLVNDLNGDGLSDIIVLMAQGDEGIDVFYNLGNCKFRKERVLRFPAVYGSVSFSLPDIDHDGDTDLVYVNGDNGDASQILKPYHGVRIFLNDGHNRFTESFFYPLHGAYKAIAADFNHDGALDVAAISFFPDFVRRPEEGFVLLENNSSTSALSFTAATFTESTKVDG